MRSGERICRSSVGVKAWQTEIPTVSAVRPARCSCCGAASRPAGRNLVIHGDGTRERQMWGPESAEGPPGMVAVRARRYQCQRCGTCMLVVPGEILRRRLYTAPAIGLALALWALLGLTAISGASPRQPAPGAGRRDGRPMDDAAPVGPRHDRRPAFPTWRAAPENFTLRKYAERAAAMLQALAPTDLPVADAVFAGAAVHRLAYRTDLCESSTRPGS